MMLPRSRLLGSIPVVLSLLAAQTGCGASAPGKAARAPESMSAPMSATSPGAAPAMEAAQAGYPSVPSAPMSDARSPASAPAPAPAPGAPTRATAASLATPATPAKNADTKSAKNAGPTTRAPVIIYQGDLHMMTDEEAIPKTIDKVIDVAESLGGHIAGRKDQSVQIKVPSASFREAMTKIEAIGGVVNRSVTADDVSEEFHDLEVRLGNLRGTRTRLQEFLGKANGIQDMLTVERELERVALEIDRIEGRLEFLRTRASMSVISVALTPKPKVIPIVVAPPPPPPQPRNGVDLPIPWVGTVGIDPLLSLRK
jgi:hypothetical protein